MATTINQLTALRVAKLKAPGYHADGGGLHLQVSQSGARSWISLIGLPDELAKWGSAHCSA